MGLPPMQPTAAATPSRWCCCSWRRGRHRGKGSDQLGLEARVLLSSAMQIGWEGGRHGHSEGVRGCGK